MTKLDETMMPDRDDAAAPRISGEFIRQALIGRVEIPADCPLTVDDRGARLDGAMVEGGLDLSAIAFDRPIAFTRCTFLDPIDLRNAKLGPLALMHCTAPAIEAMGAAIDGDLDLGGLKLDSPEGMAFCGESLRVRGSARFSDGFAANGAVDLRFAKIDAALICSGGTFCNPGPDNRETYLRRFAAATAARGAARDAALYGNGVTIGGNLMFDGGFHVVGVVNFGASRIGGNVFVDNASFESGGNWAALIITNASIGGWLRLTNLSAFEGTLFLEASTASRFSDDGTLWRDPATGAVRPGVELWIDHFRYQAFVDASIARTDTSWRTRLAWLKAQPKAHWTTNFRSQPFTQCAEVLRNMGDARGSRMILHERERLRLKAANVAFWEKLGGYVSGALAGYGYKNHYALYWALGIWLFGALIFGVANQLGQLRPADPHVLAEAHYEETGIPPRDYEPVKPALYSLDLLLPIVEIGQEQFWLPRDPGEHKADAQAAFPRLHHSLVPAANWLFGGWLPKAYYYFEIAMGWLLVSIVIAGFSGLLGHAREE
jgi:hypothetical protein